MAKKQTDSVTSLLETAASDVESLVEEMQEWQGNMEGASMEHLPKYEQVTECVDTLEGADLGSYVEALVEALSKADRLGLPFDEQIEHVVSTAKRKSRSDRCGEACGYLEIALDAIEGRLAEMRERKPDSETEETAQTEALEDIEMATADVRNAWDELQGVEFPGAFSG